ncbi:heparin lyase I family protein [Actinomycetospora sp. C-140]
MPPSTPEASAPDEHAAAPARAPSGSSASSEPATVVAESSGAPARTVWRADGPGAFGRTSWSTVGTTAPRVDREEVSFRLTGPGQRSELEPAIPTVHEGGQHDLTFSVRLDGDLATSSAARHVIARWENDGPGRAPLDLRVQGGDLVLHGGEGHPSGPRTFTRTLGHAPVGEWTHLRVLVRFSADPAKAGVSVWRDGGLVVDGARPRGGTLYPGQESYLRVGLHRDKTIARPSAARVSEWRIEHGRADTDPDRADRPRDGSTTARHSSDDRREATSGESVRRGSEGSDADGRLRTTPRHPRTAPASMSSRGEAETGRAESGDTESRSTSDDTGSP